MKKSSSACTPQKSKSIAPDVDVLGEFQIEDQQFLIISANDRLDNSPADAFSYQSSDCTILAQFNVQGCPCRIIKLEQSPTVAQVALAELLTERELQIATLVASGRPNKQIASQLHISEWTVSTHLRRIFMKLGVDSRAAMVYRCASLIQQLKGQFAAIQ